MYDKIPTLYDVASLASVTSVDGCYIFGSRVYGTSNIDSDWDVILISDEVSEETEISDSILNIHIVSSYIFEKWVSDNAVKAIECLFAPKWARLKDYGCIFNFDEVKLRHDISRTVSNSCVKAKKKMAQGDYHIGIKSLFHSIRIIDLGIQLSRDGIIYFNSCNDIWVDLVSREWTYDDLKMKYKPLYNKKMSRFRELCSK